MSKAAFNAEFADYKRVKGRKVHQLIFEVPSERFPEIYKVLGEPSIENSEHFAIAKMEYVEPTKTPENNGVNLTANAAMLLNEVSFCKFLGATSMRSADIELKARLKIKSKTELYTDATAAQRWRDLRGEYNYWMNN